MFRCIKALSHLFYNFFLTVTLWGEPEKYYYHYNVNEIIITYDGGNIRWELRDYIFWEAQSYVRILAVQLFRHPTLENIPDVSMFQFIKS